MSVVLSVTEIADDAGTRAWAKLGQVEIGAGWTEISHKLDELAARCK
jgi:hypothetical protein